MNLILPSLQTPKKFLSLLLAVIPDWFDIFNTNATVADQNEKTKSKHRCPRTSGMEPNTHFEPAFAGEKNVESQK